MRIRTGYSFRTAFGHLSDVAERINQIGWSVLPISDRMSTFAYVEWNKLAQKHNKKPLFGVELAVVPELGAKKPTPDYWTFYARDDIKVINDLIGTATSNPGKEPSLLYEQAMRAEGAVKITGNRVILDKINQHRDPCLYVGLSPSLSVGLFRQALKAGHRFIATSDNYYPTEADKELYRVALGKRSDTQTWPMHILSDDEWVKSVEWFANISPEHDVVHSALKTRDEQFNLCCATIKVATMLKPDKPKTLREMCFDGAVKLQCNLDDPIYAARLDRELKMIADKDFEDYFYIIADLVNWAKQRMIVGPARGSSCGSLACYLLGITSIDPIPFNLIFERFIDVTRKDLPDIDIDFSDQRRELVFEYAEKKYGRERVARLGTVGMFQPRSILNQAGVALRIPKWQVEKVLDGQIVRSGGDSRANLQLEDTIKETAAGRDLLKQFPEVLTVTRMEGHPNNASQHAAGIVITEEAVSNYVAIDRRSNSAMCDKYDAESLNLLKIDALGLTQLSIFERTLELLGHKPINGWLEQLPYDDQAAFDVLNKGHFSGIFQFMGGALKSLTKQFQITHIEDIISVTALARPGPMASGGANEWVKRKTGRSHITYPHELFRPYLEQTLGIVMYQEQVLQIGREIGDLSWEDVTGMRKAMSKSLGKEYFDQWGDKWKANAAAKGIPKESLVKIWDDLCAYGAWAFNRSHSVAYGLVSYWCCYLKAHYPTEFAAATLDAEKDPVRQIQLLRELRDEGIDYKPFDPDISIDRWIVHDRKLIGPLTAIKGIGPAHVSTVLAHRNGRSEKPLPAGIDKILRLARTDIDTLSPIRDSVETVDLEALNIKSTPTPVIECQCGVKGEVMVFVVLTKIAPRDENEAVNIAKRNGKVLTGPTKSLNLFGSDDTDEIFMKIDRFKFEKLGQDVIERGKAGKAIYAVKGTIPDFFRMISINKIRYLCDIVDSPSQPRGGKLANSLSSKEHQSRSDYKPYNLKNFGANGK